MLVRTPDPGLLWNWFWIFFVSFSHFILNFDFGSLMNFENGKRGEILNKIFYPNPCSKPCSKSGKFSEASTD